MVYAALPGCHDWVYAPLAKQVYSAKREFKLGKDDPIACWQLGTKPLTSALCLLEQSQNEVRGDPALCVLATIPISARLVPEEKNTSSGD